MANRENTFLLKRSNVPGKIPLPGDIKLGEVALNTADVILYASGTTANSILPIGWDRISRTGDTVTGNFIINGGLSATTISATTYLNLPNIGGGGNYLPLSGGTVTGNTVFTQGLTATTISATTYQNLPNDLPINGTTGQILAKIDNTDYNVQWIDNYTSQLKHEVKAGEAINKGQAVYVSSADGTNMIISKADYSTESTSSKTMGLLAQTLANNGIGFVITEGLLTGTGFAPLNTNSANVGDPVWLGANGNLLFGLANKPIAPLHMVFIGIVTRKSATVGEIFVKVQNGFELEELHNVRLSGVTTGDLLVRGSYGATPLWVNSKTLKGDYTISGNTSFIGSLSAKTTTNVNKFSGNTSTDLVRITQAGTGNAFVVEDSTNPDSTPFVINASGNTGIGISNPLGYKLYVNGNSNFNGDVLVSGNLTYNGNLIVSGATTIQSGLTVVEVLRLTTKPVSGYTSTQILMRNSTTGDVEITNSTSPAIYNYGMSYAISTLNFLT